MAQPQRKLPSDRTIAFAAAIVSSKPAELTVRGKSSHSYKTLTLPHQLTLTLSTEYISLLTRHVAKGRRENALSAAYRHLDRSAFWRAECERAKTDFRAAEDGRIEALREVEFVKAKLEIAKSAAGSAGGVKRKRGNADVVPYSREVKKGSSRKDAEEKREVFLGGIVIEEVEFGEEDGGGEFCWTYMTTRGMMLMTVLGQSLMRKLFGIGLYFKPGSQVIAKDLAHHLCSTAGEVATVVVDALGQQNATNGTDFAATMTAAGRVVAGILAGLQKLSRIDSSEAPQNHVTYALVRMYESLLAGFATVSKEEALSETPGASDDPKLSPVKSAKQKAKGGATRVNIKDIPVLNALASLLSGILKQLDAKQEPHKAIFEGFLFCILSRLGERVYTINFSRARAVSIMEELESASSSSDQSGTEPTPILVSKPVRQAQLEAPYLLHLLKQSLALTPSFLASPASTSKTAKTKPNPKPGSVTKTTLTHAAKERLQATLVTAIFGPEGIDEESDLFINGLQMPAAGGSGFTVPRVKEAEVGEWFQGEVWRLLGWEVLGREMNDRLRAR
jgi:hypothetical protein